MTGAFLAGYALARIGAEFFREPDDFLGFLFAGATMGQLLKSQGVVAPLASVVQNDVKPKVQLPGMN